MEKKKERRKMKEGGRNNWEKSPKVKALVRGKKIIIIRKKKKTQGKKRKCRHGACDVLAARTLPARANGSRGLFISDARLQFGAQTQ